ncbi:hypothetical protein HPC70_11340 [Flavobacterium psychrophilum]|nr:hypothetical protein HPC70_11340 [Flavobacterium psychrophilum]
MKNKIYVLLFALSPVIFSSCTDYLDVNESTNSAHTERVEPPGFLASALATTFRTQAVSMNEYGSVMTNAWEVMLHIIQILTKQNLEVILKLPLDKLYGMIFMLE